MPDRRDFLFTGLAAGSLGMSEWLRPRTMLKLMPNGKVADMVPARFGDWTEYPGGNVLVPTTPNSLADQLYSETVARIYVDASRDFAVMLLIAYGGEQSDLLQLHRPEACYPAVGYAIAERQFTSIPLSGGAQIPAVEMTAVGNDRVEDIVYWTRLGQVLPRTAGEQRKGRLSQAFHGIVGDGVLVRASSLRTTSAPTWPRIQGFLGELVAALPAQVRPGFVGSEIAKSVTA